MTSESPEDRINRGIYSPYLTLLMISYRQSQTLLGVVLVVILLSTTLVAFFVFTQIGDPDDKYRTSHEYDVTGIAEGQEVSGDGLSEYTFEPKGFVYRFTSNYSHTGGAKETFTFMLICDSKDGPATDLYEYVGEDVIDGVQCKKWKGTSGEATIQFCIDNDLVVHRYNIVDHDLSLSGHLRQ